MLSGDNRMGKDAKHLRVLSLFKGAFKNDPGFLEELDYQREVTTYNVSRLNQLHSLPAR